MMLSSIWFALFFLIEMKKRSLKLITRFDWYETSILEYFEMIYDE